MIKCLIFDLDGTLVDTLKDLGVTANETLSEFGMDNVPLEMFRTYVGDGIKKLIERCINHVNGDISLLDEVYNKFTISYKEKCLRFASLYNNIKELLDILKNEGYLLFVNTNKNEEISIKMINYLLPNYFINIYGDGSLYPRKPDPYVINMIKKEYNLLDSEVILIGDSNVDVITAHNANIKVIGCNYGFRGKEELIKYGADYLIDDALEILKIIK